jgi:hypothetical protein
MYQNESPFFDVSRNQLFAHYQGEELEVARDALINMETGKPLGTVGKTYKLIKNADVNDVFAEAFSDLPIEFTKDHLNGTSSRWQRDIILDGDQFTRTIGDNDIVKTKVSIWNGYDGRTAVGFALSAYRQVCSNGMMGWRKQFGSHFAHIERNIIEKIQHDFNKAFNGFSSNFDKWSDWNEQAFSQDQFKSFVQSRLKRETAEGDTVGYLSEKQVEAVVNQYEPVLNQYNDDETKWGAFNVLTAIATHQTEARGGGSGIFSQGYKRMERLAQDFYAFDANSELFVIS